MAKKKKAAGEPHRHTVDMTWGVYRLIYAGFLTGRRINAVSDGAEMWFWRLHALADDFGNLPACPDTLKATGAPMRRSVTPAKIKRWNEELAAAWDEHTPGLISTYSVGRDDFIHINDFEVRQPGRRNGRRIQRVPVHPGASGGIQGNPGGESASDSYSESDTDTESEEDHAPPAHTRSPSLHAAAPSACESDGGAVRLVQDDEPPPPGLEPSTNPGADGPISFRLVKRLGELYPRQVALEEAYPEIEGAIRRIAKARGCDVRAACTWLAARVSAYAGSDEAKAEQRFIPFPARWFAQGRYNDDEAVWKRQAGVGAGRDIRAEIDAMSEEGA